MICLLVACAIPLLLLTVAQLWRSRTYRASFRLATRRNDFLGSRGDKQSFSVLLDADGFDLPFGLTAQGQTAFLTWEIEATTAGHVFDPFVEVRCGEANYRQYFERGVAGRRHLNLSQIFEERRESAPARVRMQSRSVRWKSAATLVLFEAPPGVQSAQTLVLAPHPDDAEIAAFGMYATHRSWVVTITAGELGMEALSAVIAVGSDETSWCARLRVADSLTIPQLGDVPGERCLNLVYPDGVLKSMYCQPTRPMKLPCEGTRSRADLRSQNTAPEFRSATPACTWRQLVADIRRVLEASNPDIVVCPHPLIDVHPDHVFTTIALEEAAREIKNRHRFYFLYVVHPRHAQIYPFGPAESCIGYPPWTDEEWLTDSVYSVPLSPDVRSAKYFAIEAAHGLRTFSNGEPRTVGQVIRAAKEDLRALVGGTGLHATTFLRRGPRPNEIYYVVSADSLSQLVKRALREHSCVRANE
ncbi:MAG: PIG-L family deacetylase [Polyangiaceae bacterium]